MSRTALLICCSVEEAQKIHEEAENQHRTVAGCVLNIVLRAIGFEERLAAKQGRFQLSRVQASTPRGKRTAILVRCTADESNRIRIAANRRGSTISGFVLHCLNRHWRAVGALTFE